MSATIEQLTLDALKLPDAERAYLAQTMLQSLETSAPEEGVAEAWEAEVARRLERVRQGTAQGRSAEEVFADVRVNSRK